MRIQYSPEFDRRLDAFYSYIRDELKSPQSAVTNANSILDQCSLLAIMPRMGAEIHTEDGIGTGIRMYSWRIMWLCTAFQRTLSKL